MVDMKLAIATLLATVASMAGAAAFQWSGGFTPGNGHAYALDGTEVAEYSLGVFSPDRESWADGGIGLFCSLGLQDGKLVAAESWFPYGAFGVALVLADVGDTVDYESTVLSPALLKFGCVPSESGDDGYGSGVATGDYAVDLSDGRTVYLGFAHHNKMGPYDSYPDGTPPYYYGWLKVGLEDGAPKVYEAWADMTGAPARVAAVPEPGTAGLVALGAAMLALRRHART